jgi:phospholipid/cholesterol/gamma-HCH transport system permease protein
MIVHLGSWFRQKVKNWLDLYLFAVSVFMAIFHFNRLKGIGKTVLFRQIMFTGSEALTLIGFISVSISSLLVVEVHQLMGQLGQGSIVYDLMDLIVIQHVSCLITALVVIARSGTSIATELGNMVVHKEIDLLNSFGISPFAYLAAPRIVGVVVSLFTLTLYFNLMAVMGAAVVHSMFYDVDVGYFINGLIRELSFSDFIIPVVKSLLFGIAIGVFSCFQGLKVQRASTEVPQRTMRSVVTSVVSVIVLNVVVTLLYLI